MKKTTGKILAFILTLCLLLSAIPAVNAGTAYMINFSYDNSYGFVRESGNHTYAEAGKTTKIYVFPHDGCVTDSVTVKKTGTDEVISISKTGVFEGGDIYSFTMPYSDIDVDAVFSTDSEAGYHTVNVNIIGEGSITLKKNGLDAYTKKFVAHYGDKILLKECNAADGYAYKLDSSYSTPNGNPQNFLLGSTMTMPDSDITVSVEFKVLHNISIVASGGNVFANNYREYASNSYNPTSPISSEAAEQFVRIFKTPDDSHISSCLVRVVSDSGQNIYFIESAGIFEMPDEPVTVYVTFLKESYDVFCSAENGTLSCSAPDGTGGGETATLLPEPDEGYGLKELYYTYTPEIGMDEVRVDLDINGDHTFQIPDADVNAKAVFAPIYRVQWLDSDGGILDTAEFVQGTDLPTTDKVPTKAADSSYSYEFAGWGKPTYYSGNLVVIRPKFDTIYTVNVGSGTAEPSKAKAGTKITLTPNDAPANMYFSGWNVISGNVTIENNSFTMPESNVELYANYALKKNVSIDLELSDNKGYVGKPFTVSGSVKEGENTLDVGGTMTVTFSSGAPDAEGAVFYTAPVVNGEFSLDVPALTEGNRYVWAEFSGYGEYRDALVSNSINLYGVSAADLNVNFGEGNVKQTYNVCDDLDTTGLSIWYLWYDGTHEYYPVTADMVSGFDNTKSGRQTLTVASPYPTDDELSYDITMTKIYTTDNSEEINLDNYFSRDEADTADFKISSSFKKLQLLGVQKKSDGSRDIRFVAAIDSKVAKDTDEYGFIAAKGDTLAEAKGKLSGVTYSTAKNIYNCKGTSNKLSGDYGVYGTETDYKYVTLAIDNIGESAVAVKFYVKKGSKLYYADYYTKNGEWFELCAANWAVLNN